MVRSYKRSKQEQLGNRNSLEYLKRGGQVVRCGYVVTVAILKDRVVLVAWSLWRKSDVRWLCYDAQTWEDMSERQRIGAVSVAIKKPDKVASTGPGGAVEGLTLFDDFPLLRGYMLDRVYEDGSSRQPSSLTIFLNDRGRLGAALKDRDNARALFAEGLDMADIALSLEAQLESSQAPWRADKEATGSSKRIR